MKRIPEPELMNGTAQAAAYATADFSEPNQLFCELFAACFPRFSTGALLDLGCGPADICRRLALRYPELVVHGVDGAARMLEHGRAELEAAGLAGRVTLFEAMLPHPALPRSRYDAVVSNSLLHHLADPQVLWKTALNTGQPRAAVLVMDLCRPQNRAEARGIVTRYAGGEPAILQEDFYASLLAAYRPEEIASQLAEAGLMHFTIITPSDRHLAVYGSLPD